MVRQRMKRNACVCFAVLFFLSGCWDSSDIEDMSFVIGFGYDSSENEETPMKHTTQIAVTKKKGEQAAAQEGKMYQDITMEGNSLHDILRSISLQLPYPVYTDHLESIVINSETAAKYDLSILLDQILRDNVTRLSPVVVLSKQQASDVLNTNIEGEIPSSYIGNLFDNESATMKMLPPVRVGDIAANLSSHASFVLPNVTKKKNTILVQGAGVIRGKDNKLAGFLTDEDVQGMNWLTGEAKGGLLNLKDEKDNTIVYEVQHYKTKVQPLYKEGRLTFQVKVTSQGWISEDWSQSSNNLSERYVQKLEKLAEKQVVKLMEGTMKKLQSKYQSDVIKFNDSFRINYPRDYQKMKKDWDMHFADADVHYDVKIKIINTGDMVKD